MLVGNNPGFASHTSNEIRIVHTENTERLLAMLMQVLSLEYEALTLSRYAHALFNGDHDISHQGLA